MSACIIDLGMKISSKKPTETENNAEQSCSNMYDASENEAKRAFMKVLRIERTWFSPWIPFSSDFFTFPTIISPTNGLKTINLNSSLVCDAPSPGYIIGSPTLSKSKTEMQKPTLGRTWGAYKEQKEEYMSENRKITTMYVENQRDFSRQEQERTDGRKFHVVWCPQNAEREAHFSAVFGMHFIYQSTGIVFWEPFRCDADGVSHVHQNEHFQCASVPFCPPASAKSSKFYVWLNCTAVGALNLFVWAECEQNRQSLGWGNPRAKFNPILKRNNKQKISKS